MKSVLSALAIATLVVAPAQASEPAANTVSHADLRLGAAPSVDPHNLALARQFIDLLYPVATREQDSLEQIRAGYAPALEMFENASVRAAARRDIEKVVAKVMPVMQRRMPALMETYAKAYAREYSADELRELIAFAATPTGRHFMHDLDFAGRDDAVIEANAAMLEELSPMFEELGKAMCQRKTELRIAAGDTKAKCGMA